MVFRRAGWRLAPWYGLVAVMWLLAFTFALAFVVAVFSVRPVTWSSVVVTLLIGINVWPPAGYAWSLWGSIRDMRTYFLRIAAEGVEFQLPGTGVVQLPWSEIREVTVAKVWVKMRRPLPFAYQNYVYTMKTARSKFAFSGFEIPRAKRAAREISARCQGAATA